MPFTLTLIFFFLHEVTYVNITCSLFFLTAGKIIIFIS